MQLPKIFSDQNKAKLSDSELLFILESLAAMLSSGISIVEALNSIEEDTPSKKTRSLIHSIVEDISSGKSLSESFGKFPESFDSVFLSIIKSGEASGKLDKVLQSAAISLKESIETKGNIKSALFYPAIVISVLCIVTFLVFGYSLPQVAKVFFDLKIKLPSYSATVLHIALWFGDNKVYIVVVLAVLIFSSYFLLKINSVKKQVFGLVFQLPVISNIIRLIDLASFSQTTGLLLTSGVPILDALAISKNVVNSRRLHADIEKIINKITEGSTLEEAMKTVPRSFPALLRRVIGVGEETGNLDTELEDISKFYNRKFTEIIKNLTVIIEPVLIVVIAVLVALVLVSVVLPIYQGSGSINRH